MTGIGLAVALPAVMGYNWLTRANRVLTAKLDAFAFELLDLPVDGPRPAGAGTRRRARQRAAEPPSTTSRGERSWPSEASTARTRPQPMAEINMVPLIDVVLVLLVIFIVTAPLLTNAVKLDLPKASSHADIQKPEKIEFAIDATGALFWNGERITREDAVAKFAEAGPEAAAARGPPARRPGRGLPLRRRDAGRRLQGGPEQDRLRQRAGAVTPRWAKASWRARLRGESFGAVLWSSFLCRSIQGRRLRHRTTIRTSGSRTSRARGRSPGSRHRTSGRLRPSARTSLPPIGTPSRRSLDRPDKIPFIGRRGPWFYNFWTDAAAPARPVAAHHARELPARAARTGKSCSTSTRWPRRRARTGSGAAPRHGRARTTAPSCACRAAAAMRSCCASSISRRKAFVADGFVLPEAKGDASWLDADTLLLSSAWGGDVTTSGYARTVRLWRRGTDAARGAGRCSRCRARACRLGAAVDRTRGRPSRSGSTTRSASSTSMSGRRRTVHGDEARPADRRRRSMRIAAGSRSSRARPGRSAARPSPATPCSASGSTTFLAGSRDFAVLFEPGARRVAARLLLERRAAGAVDPRQPAAGVRGPDARPTAAGRGTTLDRPAGDRRGQRLAARCRSGGEPTATCWPARRIR